jgi:hypothetical protein
VQVLAATDEHGGSGIERHGEHPTDGLRYHEKSGPSEGRLVHFG